MAKEIKQPNYESAVSEEFYADDRQYDTITYPADELPTRPEVSE